MHSKHSDSTNDDPNYSVIIPVNNTRLVVKDDMISILTSLFSFDFVHRLLSSTSSTTLHSFISSSSRILFYSSPLTNTNADLVVNIAEKCVCDLVILRSKCEVWGAVPLYPTLFVACCCCSCCCVIKTSKQLYQLTSLTTASTFSLPSCFRWGRWHRCRIDDGWLVTGLSYAIRDMDKIAWLTTRRTVVVHQRNA